MSAAAANQLRELRRDLDLLRVMVMHRLDVLTEAQTVTTVRTLREIQNKLDRVETRQREILAMLYPDKDASR